MNDPEKLRKLYWKEDKQNGSVVKKQYDEIKSVLSNVDKKWVDKKLLDIKQYAIDYTEFYKKFSVKDNFPVVNKTSILANYEQHKSKGDFCLPIHISSTSGSTGTPFAVCQDYLKRQRTIADLKVFGEFCDYPSHECMLFFRGTTKGRTKEQEEKENIFYIDCGNLGEDNLSYMYEAIVQKKPRIIFSYSSTLIELAKYIDKHQLKQDFSMKSALIAGEGLSDENRLFLQSVYGCKVYRRYSDMELGILGQDMGDGGEYHMNYGSYYFECLKLDSDDPTVGDEVGRIVVTDLFNKAFPMLRYDTGDLGVMKKNEKGFPVFTEIYGKKMDCVYSTEGEIISPHKLEILMWGVKGVKQWQFVQDEKNKYHFNINGDPKADYTSVVEKFKGYLGENALIEFNFIDEIPALSSNKRRMVICNYIK